MRESTKCLQFGNCTQSDIRETFLISQMLKGVHHVGLEVVPS